MLNPQDMIDDAREANNKKAELIENLEARIGAKNKILVTKESMVEAEMELKLPVHLSISDISCCMICGDFFQGDWLKFLIVRAFGKSDKIRGCADKLIKEEALNRT